MKGNRKPYQWAVRVLVVLTVAILLCAATSSAAQEGNPNLQAQQGTPDGGEGVEPFEVDAGPEAMLGKVIVIPPAAFVYDGFTAGKYIMAGGYLTGQSITAAGMVAPVILPEGASRLTGVRIYAHDSSSGYSSHFCLRRITLSTGSSESLGCVTTSDSAGVEMYKIVPTKKYVSSDRAYEILLSAVEDIYVYGVKVGYG